MVKACKNQINEIDQILILSDIPRAHAIKCFIFKARGLKTGWPEGLSKSRPMSIKHGLNDKEVLTRKI